MKNYAKIILYAYPFLRTVGKDYEEHIRNRAVTSYDSRFTAEGLAEYLAGEILEMRRLEWLKEKVEEVLGKLSSVEKTLVAIRYFGKEKGVKRLVKTDFQPLGKKRWTERTYFRRQQRLGERLQALLILSGITEQVYEEKFAGVELFAKIGKAIEAGKDKNISVKERRWLA